MSDLLTIFHKSPPSYPQKQPIRYPSSPSPSPYHQQPPSPSSSPQFTQQPSQQQQQQSINTLLHYSSFTKKMVTQTCMRQQIHWFNYNLKAQGFIKIIIMLVIIILAYKFDVVGFQMAVTLFVNGFLYYGVEHVFFGIGMISKWGTYSLYATSFILTHLTYTSIMQKLSINFHKTQPSLLPTIQLSTILFLILIHCTPIFQPTNKSTMMNLTENLTNYTSQCWYITKRIYAAKYTIFIIYVLVGLLEVGCLLYCCDIMGININMGMYMVCGQVLTAGVMVGLFVFMDGVIGETVGFWVVFWGYEVGKRRLPVSYGDKKANGIPIIIELLRFNQQANNNEREYAQKIYVKSMKWILNLLVWSPDALNTKITNSRLYNTYWDIFKVFAENQLQRSTMLLMQLQQKSERLKRVMGKKPNEDIFIYFRILHRYYCLWSSAIAWVKHMKIIGLISKILCQCNCRQSGSIHRYLREISQKIKSLKHLKLEQIDRILVIKLNEEQQNIQRTLRAIN